MPLFRRKKRINYSGDWVTVPETNSDALVAGNPDKPGDNFTGMPANVKVKKKKTFRVVTVRGVQEQNWLDSSLWQPPVETVTPQEARSPLTVVYYGTYGSDGMRRDGAPGGAYSTVFDQYAMKGLDLYTKDEARVLKQWDTRRPFPGFDPKLGSKTLDIYSED